MNKINICICVFYYVFFIIKSKHPLYDKAEFILIDLNFIHPVFSRVMQLKTFSHSCTHSNHFELADLVETNVILFVVGAHNKEHSNMP